ncbi:hypothetical protein KFK09_028871 [Dendrobium nobile]|uniref:Uncharacterized protein n=1 Tax=Dendrobium nobile TaxID=94219 RepID=A0A8T3A4Q7_DENNO|nr:hypothetical protein KFK09_028871 [Dendrobium nobile]
MAEVPAFLLLGSLTVPAHFSRRRLRRLSIEPFKVGSQLRFGARIWSKTAFFLSNALFLSFITFIYVLE